MENLGLAYDFLRGSVSRPTDSLEDLFHRWQSVAVGLWLILTDCRYQTLLWLSLFILVQITPSFSQFIDNSPRRQPSDDMLDPFRIRRRLRKTLPHTDIPAGKHEKCMITTLIGVHLLTSVQLAT